MKWYTGGIAEAITASKSKGAIFVVYIEGTDEQSKKITELIDNGDLGQQLEQDYFVAIKIQAGSMPHQQFSEIFPEPSVPSVYFIGKSGAPLDIVTATDSLENLNQRVASILEKAGISQSKIASSISESLIQNEQTSSDNSNNYVCENGVCRLITNVPTTSGVDNSSEAQEKKELTHEEKVQKAKELVEQKRLEKEQQDKEIERLKEIERRKMGQGVQQLKQWQEDQELKQLKEERDREKKENQIARERVLAQIAQDKAERLSKARTHSPPSEETKPMVVPVRVNSNTTRLQFKMPDGSFSTQDFVNSDLLQTVVTHIKSNLKLPFKDFSLSTVYPRREFTLGDYSQTLLDLQLTPNAVILVLPMNRGAISTNPGGSLSAMLWNLIAPLFNLFGYLKTFVFGTGTSTSGSKRPSEDRTEARHDNSKRRMRDSTVVKKQGNVHRLGDRRDSDEDQNTWNGNSTQQM